VDIGGRNKREFTPRADFDLGHAVKYFRPGDKPRGSSLAAIRAARALTGT
jgi:hypothetical protein